MPIPRSVENHGLTLRRSLSAVVIRLKNADFQRRASHKKKRHCGNGVFILCIALFNQSPK
jgi:hypothetical protein